MVRNDVVPVQRVGGHLVGVHLFLVEIVTLYIANQTQVGTVFEHVEVGVETQTVGVLAEGGCAQRHVVGLYEPISHASVEVFGEEVHGCVASEPQFAVVTEPEQPVRLL